MSADGVVHVSFPNAFEIEYRIGGKLAHLQAERNIAPDGAPDGRIVEIADGMRWADGSIISQSEIDLIVADLIEAAAPLRTRFIVKDVS
ncbi:hypothetical protein [Tsuneonella sp. SYSU-LHT278]|uniref:hypothetical protein n=1 Tax=Tsuneonella sediminis TaxID=3416089 RepID=UPI003F7AC0A4